MHKSRKSGFTLIELSIALIIVGLLTAAILGTLNPGVHKKQIGITNERLTDIKMALINYKAIHNRLPCPASLTAAPATAQFGVEVSTDCNSPSATLNGTIRTNGVAITIPPAEAGSRKIRIGAVPVITLGLSSAHIADYWGYRFVYAVSEDQATEGIAYNDMKGAITLLDANDAVFGPRPNQTSYVVVSLGRDGKGGVTYEGSYNTTTCPTSGPQKENCSNTSIFRTAEYSEAEDNINYYDDIVLASLSLPNLPPPKCTSGQMLVSFDGSNLVCAAPPACSGSEILTTDGTSFTCVASPVAGGGTTADPTTPITLPVCAEGQILTSNGTNVTCVTQSSRTCYWKGRAYGVGSICYTTNPLGTCSYWATRTCQADGTWAANALGFCNTVDMIFTPKCP